jgi:hypothetical protein
MASNYAQAVAGIVAGIGFIAAVLVILFGIAEAIDAVISAFH